MPLDCKETLEFAIRKCSRGEWSGGLIHLRRLKRQEGACGGLPGDFYSYLGLALARCEGRMHEGREWCQHAVRVEPANPVNYLNLAQTCLLLEDRQGAKQAVRQGLAADSGNQDLLELRRELGFRSTWPGWLPGPSRRIGRLLDRLEATVDVSRPPRQRALGDETTGVFRPAD